MTTIVTKNKNSVFDKNFCIKCRDPKSIVVTRGLDKLIQISNFIRNERLRLYLPDSKKNGVTVKVHCAFQKIITIEIKCKEDPVPTTSRKISRVTRSNMTDLSCKTHCFYCGSPSVPDSKHP